MDALSLWIREQLGLSPAMTALVTRAVSTLVVVLVLWALRRLGLAVVYRRVTDPWSRYRWRKGATYTTVAVGVLLVGRIWIAGVGTIATFLGLVSAGLAIALKDLVSNVAGWLIIVSRRPFEVGDRIEIGPHAGDVIDVRLLTFTLLEIGGWVDADQSTGRLIHIPNNKVLTEPLANYNRGFRYIWNEVPVVVTFESDWKKAKGILERVVNRHGEHLTPEAERDLLAASQQYLIYFRKLTPIVYTDVVNDGVRLTMRYLIEPRHRRGSEQAIWQDVLEEFANAPDVDFAYITRRGFSHATEGKVAMRAVQPGAPPGSTPPPPLPPPAV